MGFREVSVVGVKEILRLWLLGHGQRAVARLAQADRKTVARYVEAAQKAGLARGDPEGKLTDELIGEVVVAVRPGRPPGDRGVSWRSCANTRTSKGARRKEAHARQDPQPAASPHRTLVSLFDLHRFCAQELNYGRANSTVRVADCDPGQELQIDFGRMGLLFDLDSARRRVVHALIFTAVSGGGVKHQPRPRRASAKTVRDQPRPECVPTVPRVARFPTVAEVNVTVSPSGGQGATAMLCGRSPCDNPCCLFYDASCSCASSCRPPPPPVPVAPTGAVLVSTLLLVLEKNNVACAAASNIWSKPVRLRFAKVSQAWW